MTLPRLLRDRPAVQILALAFGLRLLVAALTANLYDPDEFVYLTLGRVLAHGAVPYRDFAFFHPPGILVILGVLNPLVGIWWPAARIFELAIDSLTAVLVYRIGLQLYARRQAVAAGLLYAISPVALITGIRVLQEPLMTFLGVAALALLLTRRSTRSTVVAGVLIGLAVWIKYPAAIFLGVALLADRRRFALLLLSALATLAVLFAPYAADLHALVSDTILWQLSRPVAAFGDRLQITVAFLLLANPLILVAWRLERRAFLWFGYAGGAAFLFASQAYYHYFLPCVPFAALLGAPVAAGLPRLSPRVILAATIAVAAGWGAAMNLAGPNHLFVSSAALSSVAPVTRYLDRHSRPSQAVLGDRFEYAYLSRRIPYQDYYWNLARSIRSHRLETDLDARAVVRTGGEWQSFPPGLARFLSRHYPHARVGSATVWEIGSRHSHVG